MPFIVEREGEGGTLFWGMHQNMIAWRKRTFKSMLSWVGFQTERLFLLLDYIVVVIGFSPLFPFDSFYFSSVGISSHAHFTCVIHLDSNTHFKVAMSVCNGVCCCWGLIQPLRLLVLSQQSFTAFLSRSHTLLGRGSGEWPVMDKALRKANTRRFN